MEFATRIPAAAVAALSPLGGVHLARFTDNARIGGMSTVAIDNLLSTEEAAQLIGCTEGRVCQLLREGKIKGKKFNERAWAVDRDSAAKYRDAPQTVGRPRISA